MAELYDKFVKLRDERGDTNASVSKGTGLNPAVLSEWKSGRSVPKVDKIQKIANYFGVGLDYFYGGE